MNFESESPTLTEVQIAYLAARIQNMRIYLNNPSIHRISPKYSLALPVLRLEPVHDQKTLDDFNHIAFLLDEFRCEALKMEELIRAQQMIGSLVIKKSRKPFQSGVTVVKVRNVIRHPYKTGWHLAYVFEVDGSCVEVKQVKPYYHG